MADESIPIYTPHLMHRVLVTKTPSTMSHFPCDTCETDEEENFILHLLAPDLEAARTAHMDGKPYVISCPACLYSSIEAIGIWFELQVEAKHKKEEGG